MFVWISLALDWKHFCIDWNLGTLFSLCDCLQSWNRLEDRTMLSRNVWRTVYCQISYRRINIWIDHRNWTRLLMAVLSNITKTVLQIQSSLVSESRWTFSLLVSVLINDHFLVQMCPTAARCWHSRNEDESWCSGVKSHWKLLVLWVWQVK